MERLDDGNADADGMQRFSATGRPYQSPTNSEKHQAAVANIGIADSMGRGPANLLPRKYTDDSLISVPCLSTEDIGRTTSSAAGPVTGLENEKSSRWWKSRRRSKDGGSNENFVIKQIPRGEYLKHYAKDDDGRYCGSEDPADDCILRGQDVQRYRGDGPRFAQAGFQHEIEDEDEDNLLAEKKKQSKEKKKDGFMARLKNEIHEGIEHSEERRNAAPKLNTRGVIGIGLGAGLK